MQEEVTVAQIDENKFWVKIIIEKKRGSFSKLVETLNYFGIELMDTNLTTTKGAFLITSCIQVILRMIIIRLFFTAVISQIHKRLEDEM